MSSQDFQPPAKCDRCSSVDVHSRAKYGAFGWFALVMGVGVLPKAVEYFCAKCNKILGETTDMAAREAKR